jgi:threonine synthase
MQCVTCARRFAADELCYTCPDCGPLAGTLDVIYDLVALQRDIASETMRARPEPTIWRYHELLPVGDLGGVVPIPVGMTPLTPLDVDLGAAVPRRLLAKDDTRMPSASSKDRASAVAVAHARQLGRRRIAAASTGNAASSLAMFAARAGLECFIFVPASAPPAKLRQIQAHGAHLFAVDGTYDQAFELCAAFCAELDCYSRNTATNPVLAEGKKTLALEIWEQLGGRAPEMVVVPVGDGCILSGVYKGFADLLALGWITDMPKLVGVQAAGSAALAAAWRAGRDTCEPVDAHTVADSISVSQPRDQRKALRAMRQTGGFFVTVSDEAILDALSLLATRAGMLVEPAAAAPLAGLLQAVSEGSIATDTEAVLLHTGHGLKDVHALEKAARADRFHHVAPTLDAVAAAMRES